MLNSLDEARFNKRGFLISFVVIATCTMLAIVLDHFFLPKSGILLVLQLGVIILSIIGNKAIALTSGILSATSYNYFFTEPRYSLHMTDAEDIVNTLVFLTIAFITSHFSIYHRTQREALKQAELRTNILLSVSHDLRTPLSGIIGTLSTFQEYQQQLSEKERDELLSGALEETHRLHLYIENLLHVTKLQNNKIKLAPTFQQVWPILHRVKERLNTNRVQIEKTANIPDIHVQDTFLEQAIYNLVDNALKYSPENTPVTIKVLSDTHSVHIQVSDNGPGIPDDLKEKVFDVFYSNRTGDAGEGGTGLGLTVARGIVAAHNGTLKVLSTHQGCTMEICLPICEMPHS